MTTHNAANERIKRQYFSYLKDAKQQSEVTVDAVAKAISRFETDVKFKDFKSFHIEQAIAFKRHLADADSLVTGEKLSTSTLYATFAHLKRFFQWLAMQPGYRSRIRYADAEYFNLSGNEARVATTRREQDFPTLEQLKQVIALMAHDGEIDQRNRALLAFTVLTGARVGAVASVKMRHIDMTAGSVYQDARQVRTKFGKSYTTFFFPVDGIFRGVLDQWVAYLRETKHYGNDDPLFPATQVVVGSEGNFERAGLSRTHWRGTTAIREIFANAFKAAGLRYFNPHSLRRTLVQLGETRCQTPEAFKAWSQNLGHEGALTTFLSYGEVGTRRQGEILRALSGATPPEPVDYRTLAKAIAQEIRESGSGG